MNRVSRTSLSLALAAAACLTAPLALAQSTDTAADPAATATQDTSAQTSTQAAPTEEGAQFSADAGATSWNDLDLDMDGRISKAEAAAMPALEQVFDEADGDADGALTSEEYQTYIANPGAGANPPQG